MRWGYIRSIWRVENWCWVQHRGNWIDFQSKKDINSWSSFEGIPKLTNKKIPEVLAFLLHVSSLLKIHSFWMHPNKHPATTSKTTWNLRCSLKDLHLRPLRPSYYRTFLLFNSQPVSDVYIFWRPEKTADVGVTSFFIQLKQSLFGLSVVCWFESWLTRLWIHKALAMHGLLISLHLSYHYTLPGVTPPAVIITLEVYDPSMMKIRLTHKRAYVPGSKLRDGHPTFNRESL